MFERFKLKKKEKSELDKQIEKRIEGLEDSFGKTDLDSDRIDNVKELVEIKTQLEGRKEKISPNTVVAGVFSIGSVVAIMVYENRHVFASAAKNFIPKLRV